MNSHKTMKEWLDNRHYDKALCSYVLLTNSVRKTENIIQSMQSIYGNDHDFVSETHDRFARKALPLPIDAETSYATWRAAASRFV